MHIARVTGIAIGNLRICDRVDPYVGILHVWDRGSLKVQLDKVQRAFKSLPPPVAAVATRAKPAKDPPKHDMFKGNSFAVLSKVQAVVEKDAAKKSWKAQQMAAQAPTVAAPPQALPLPPMQEPPSPPMVPPPLPPARPVAFVFGAPPESLERVEAPGEEKRARVKAREGPLRDVPQPQPQEMARKRELLQAVANGATKVMVTESRVFEKLKIAARRVEDAKDRIAQPDPGGAR